jgi:hypothetical protein
MYDLVDLIMPSLASRHWYFLTDFRIKPVIKRKMRIPQHHPGDVSFSRHSTLLLTQQGYGDARSNHGDPGTVKIYGFDFRRSWTLHRAWVSSTGRSARDAVLVPP